MLLVPLPECDPPGFLAWEEALLDAVDAGAEDLLWFWESPVPFVVVGYGQSRARETNLAACEGAGIPVLRRSSGGGTVLQGPGCLSYGLALRIEPGGPLDSITGANRAILSRATRALQPLLGHPVSVDGHTDLTLLDSDGRRRKFSGNAQRRKRHALLFHGTILLSLDLGRMSEFLRPPSWEPEYRTGRNHAEFLVNTRLSPDTIQKAFSAEWSLRGLLTDLPIQAHRQHLESRYGRPDWHARR
ncbi:MAG: lipoate--protein ligase family protein [Verrucomicrobiae bacterium]|nr:lipoate--protein ligase family protein [Verrucomicrobiae bacterium]